MTGRRSSVIARGAVVGAMAVIIIGAALTATPTHETSTHLAHRALLDEAARLALSAFIALLVVVAGVLVALLVGRDLFARRTLLAPTANGIPRWQRIVIAFATLVLITGLGYLAVVLGHHVVPRRSAPPPGGNAAAHLLSQARHASTHFALLPPVLIGVGILGILGVVTLLSKHRRRRSSNPPRDLSQSTPPTPTYLDGASLRALTDPRQQVQGAWHLAETALAQDGFPRDPAESASEYHRRLLRLDAAPVELGPLLALFLHAKYSSHALDAHDGSVAIDLAELILARVERIGAGA